jgi:hypothetical protein
MDTSLVSGRFWGIVLVVLSGSMLVNSKFHVRLVKGFQDEAVRFFYFFVSACNGGCECFAHKSMEVGSQRIDNTAGVGIVVEGIMRDSAA